jgi:hypothetical protein
MKIEPGQTYRYMLHRQVMVVARIRHDGWKAYCFPVPGKNHDNEEYLWETEGAQLIEPVAREMFNNRPADGRICDCEDAPCCDHYE